METATVNRGGREKENSVGDVFKRLSLCKKTSDEKRVTKDGDGGFLRGKNLLVIKLEPGGRKVQANAKEQEEGRDGYHPWGS